MKSDFAYRASRATEPFFYHAPHGQLIEPRGFQFAGAEYCLARNHGLIGDEPGLGKTGQGVMVDNAILSTRTLAIVPASLRLNWEREVWRWSTVENVKTHVILSGNDGVDPDADWCIVSYDLLRNESILDSILDLRWDHCILDEAHYLKDPKGNQRTRYITAPDELPSVIGRFTALSGTIMPNQPSEVYNMARLLDWDCIDNASLEDFMDTYYEVGDGGFVTKKVYDPKIGAEIYKTVWDENVRNQPCNLDDLQQRLRRNIMVRRTRKHVLHELPPVAYHMVPVAQTAEIRKAMRHEGYIAAERLYDIDPNSFDRGIPPDGAIATARRLLGESKVPSVVKYIDELFAEGVEKLVVGAWHLSVLAMLRDKLAKYGVCYMDGSTTPRAKQMAVDQFQEGGARIILGQKQPLGEGWTLTQAKDVVDAEFDWTPGRNDQLLYRINRMGQTGDYTLGHVPYIVGSLDERIIGTAVWKDGNIHQALDAE